MNKAIILQGDDWEGLYVNGYLVDEGHTLNEGYDRIDYFKEMSKQHDFDLMEIYCCHLDARDLEILEEAGTMPYDIGDFKYDYMNLLNSLKNNNA